MKKRTLLRFIAIFFAVETLVNVCLPTITYALTAGPTAPEATSFEPVDTTDMVNPLTGDLTYNIPLLEVPGPSGGYPLSLSYHAGIMPNEEASWVGLGWTLNPGAINRNVNGFADDHWNVTNTDRFFWEGGVTKSFNVGVSVGIGNTASVSAGLSFSQDTYQGFGVGAYTGFGVRIGGEDSPISANASLGVSPYGGVYASTGLGARIGEAGEAGLKLSTSIGISTNFKSVSGYTGAGVSYTSEKIGTDKKTVEGTYNNSLLGASIATGGVKPSLSVGGGSLSINNSKSGNVSTGSSGFNVPIPIVPGVSVSLGYKYQYYWIDETENATINGVLHYPTTEDSWAHYDNHPYNTQAFDTYTLLDPTLDGGIVDNPESDKVMGGSFPNYDNYAVNAQGVSGNMRPHLFKKHLARQNIRKMNNDGDYEYDIIQEMTGYDNNTAEFRFINDFSNRHEYEPSVFTNESNVDPLIYDFYDGTTTTGENGDDGIAAMHLAGSKHIDYLTHKQINDVVIDGDFNEFGVVENTSSGFNRSALTPEEQEQIGAFVITNESGVKYHFTLPAFSYEEYQHSENITHEDGMTFNSIKKPEKYAYTWYLTAVTGPDYVDRNENNKVDEEDWGYWVEMEYGKWTDKYAWRNPGEGMQQDIDNNFQNFAEGKKEVYYLDAVRTKTHTALFVKDIRNDGKSTVYYERHKDYYDMAGTNLKMENLHIKTKDGGYMPEEATNYSLQGESSFEHYYSTSTYIPKPVSSLKLEKILLLKNEDVSIGKEIGAQYNQSYEVTISRKEFDEDGNQLCVRDYDEDGRDLGCAYDGEGNIIYQEPVITTQTIVQHYPNNVLDVNDISETLENKALRVIDLDTDYSLTPGTANSFDSSNLLGSSDASTNSANYSLSGKLTLNSLGFLGKGGADLIPPMEFEYDLDEKYITGQLEGNNYLFGFGNSIEPGDLIKIKNGSDYAYFLVYQDYSDIFRFKFLGGKAFPDDGQMRTVQYSLTKNPPYNKDNYDVWGMYKSDYVSFENENLKRLVSQISASNLDVWSLKNIGTSLGSTIKINYGPDEYTTPKLIEAYPFQVETAEKISDSNVEIKLYETPDDLKKGTKINLIAVLADTYELTDETGCGYYGGVGVTYRVIETNGEISKTPTDVITISSSNFSQLLDTRESDYFGEVGCDNDNAEFRRDFNAPVIIGGNFSSTSINKTFFGGGLHVNSIQLENEVTGEINSTYYIYNKLNETEITSGVTSYEPMVMDYALMNLDNVDSEFNAGSELPDEIMQSYNKKLNGKFGDLLSISRETPAPGVMYEYVTIKESVIHKDGTEDFLPSHSTYHFEVFDVGMVGIPDSPIIESEDWSDNPHPYGGFTHNKIKTRNIIMKDYTTRVGNLKSIILYDEDGNKLSETTNDYLHDAISVAEDATPKEKLQANIDHEVDLAQYNNQGVIEETFIDARFVREDTGWELLGLISKREQFPTIQIGQTNTNYKTGITTTSKNLAFDFYSGQVTKTLSTDGYGNAYISEVTPAYKIYTGVSGPGIKTNGMGLAIHGGHNMLTQVAANTTYRVKDEEDHTPEGLVSATVQTWGDDVKVLGADLGHQMFKWRKKASYSWIGDKNLDEDGLYHYANFSDYFSDPSSSGWQKNGEITLYDIYSHALEATDVNGKYAATKMDSKQEQVFATVANASYNEFCYSGAEDDVISRKFGGDVQKAGAVSTDMAHTGDKSIKVTNAGTAALRYTATATQDRTFHTSVWSSEMDGKIKYKINGGAEQLATLKPVKSAGSWHLLRADIPGINTGDEIEIIVKSTTANTYFDDFRVHPIDAAMTSYVYNDWGELSHILDANNLFTEYRYDGMGRLEEVYRETFTNGVKRVSKNVIHYGLSTNQ